MAKKYLDDTGMSYFWGKLKDHFQAKLVSGTNIKTIHSESVLGSGDISLIDVFYPVGSYYETSDTSFDPNSSWGGTWVLETEGMVHVSGGTNYAVAKANNNNGQGEKDGGEATVTLSIDTMPNHTHIQNQHRHGIQYVGSTGAGYGLQDTGTGRSSGYFSSQYETATNQTTGGGQPHNNMQPYISVNRWHRTT